MEKEAQSSGQKGVANSKWPKVSAAVLTGVGGWGALRPKAFVLSAPIVAPSSSINVSVSTPLISSQTNSLPPPAPNRGIKDTSNSTRIPTTISAPDPSSASAEVTPPLSAMTTTSPQGADDKAALPEDRVDVDVGLHRRPTSRPTISSHQRGESLTGEGEVKHAVCSKAVVEPPSVSPTAASFDFVESTVRATQLAAPPGKHQKAAASLTLKSDPTLYTEERPHPPQQQKQQQHFRAQQFSAAVALSPATALSSETSPDASNNAAARSGHSHSTAQRGNESAEYQSEKPRAAHQRNSQDQTPDPAPPHTNNSSHSSSTETSQAFKPKSPDSMGSPHDGSHTSSIQSFSSIYEDSFEAAKCRGLGSNQRTPSNPKGEQIKPHLADSNQPALPISNSTAADAAKTCEALRTRSLSKEGGDTSRRHNSFSSSHVGQSVPTPHTLSNKVFSSSIALTSQRPLNSLQIDRMSQQGLLNAKQQPYRMSSNSSDKTFMTTHQEALPSGPLSTLLSSSTTTTTPLTEALCPKTKTSLTLSNRAQQSSRPLASTRSDAAVVNPCPSIPTPHSLQQLSASNSTKGVVVPQSSPAAAIWDTNTLRHSPSPDLDLTRRLIPAAAIKMDFTPHAKETRIKPDDVNSLGLSTQQPPVDLNEHQKRLSNLASVESSPTADNTTDRADNAVPFSETNFNSRRRPTSTQTTTFSSQPKPVIHQVPRSQLMQGATLQSSSTEEVSSEGRSASNYSNERVSAHGMHCRPNLPRHEFHQPSVVTPDPNNQQTTKDPSLSFSSHSHLPSLTSPKRQDTNRNQTRIDENYPHNDAAAAGGAKVSGYSNQSVGQSHFPGSSSDGQSSFAQPITSYRPSDLQHHQQHQHHQQQQQSKDRGSLWQTTKASFYPSDPLASQFQISALRDSLSQIVPVTAQQGSHWPPNSTSLAESQIHNNGHHSGPSLYAPSGHQHFMGPNQQQYYKQKQLEAHITQLQATLSAHQSQLHIARLQLQAAHHAAARAASDNPQIIIQNTTEVAASSSARSEILVAPLPATFEMPQWLVSFLSSRVNQFVIMGGTLVALQLLRNSLRRQWRLEQLQRREDTNLLLRVLRLVEKSFSGLVCQAGSLADNVSSDRPATSGLGAKLLSTVVPGPLSGVFGI